MNCYLVREDDGYALIDGNLKGSAIDILKAAGKIPIKRILLTHLRRVACGHGKVVDGGRELLQGTIDRAKV